MGLTRVFLIFLLITTVFSSAEGPSDAISGKTADFKASKGKSENLLYIYFGGEGQLLMNGAQKVFNNGFQAGLNWMGVGGCIGSLCADYEITYESLCRLPLERL